MENLALPVNFVSNIGTDATAFLSFLSPYLSFIVGILLAALVVGMIIQAMKH